MKKVIATLVIAFGLVTTLGCSHTETYTAESMVQSKSQTGEVDVYEQGVEVTRPYRSIGTVWFGESGFSESCGIEDALFNARATTREMGADALIVEEVRKPDWKSTCYRVSVRVIEYTD
jgi:hypothetical protein